MPVQDHDHPHTHDFPTPQLEIVYQTLEVEVAAGATEARGLSGPAIGDKVVSGGYFSGAPDSVVEIYNGPNLTATPGLQWETSVRNDAPTSVTVTFYVVAARLS